MTTKEASAGSSLIVRAPLGGVLMGLANLVPGISGGTMLLATGVYTQFVEAIAEVTTLRFRARSLALLAMIGLAALATIVLLAGPIKGLVVDYRWVMYAIFIGLTFGGIPVVRRMLGGFTPRVFLGLVMGAVIMVGLAVMNWAGIGGASSSGTGLLFVAGLLGASAMVLPGISGAYMLLILGQYEPILDALHALKGGEVSGTLAVVAPVGIGVVAGIVGVSNLIRWALVRHEDLTLGFLLGLLIGSVVGIFPFQRPIEVDSTLMEVYAPTVGQAAAAVGLAVVGFGLTALIDRMGGQSTT